ncbi:hypothetical protein ABW21_db0208488 [Orbilia brochopaga]|nr:hypothetical protein ABW21_db0208488 [Drechslerella brochopaga]
MGIPDQLQESPHPVDDTAKERGSGRKMDRIAIGLRTMASSLVEAEDWWAIDRDTTAPAYLSKAHYGIQCTPFGTISFQDRTLDFQYDLGDRGTDIRAKVLGCGINMVDRVVFFTLDGKVETKPCYIPPGVYFPTFVIPKNHEGCRVNFGAKPFHFEDANDPDWEWKIPLSECYKVDPEAIEDSD